MGDAPPYAPYVFPVVLFPWDPLSSGFLFPGAPLSRGSSFSGFLFPGVPLSRGSSFPGFLFLGGCTKLKLPMYKTDCKLFIFSPFTV